MVPDRPVGRLDARVAAEALGRSTLFAGLEGEDREHCLAAFRERRFRRGEAIFHAGDPGDTLHVVASGSAKIELPAPDGGQAAVIATVRPGDAFGELALIDGAARSATVTALEPTTTLALGRETFLGLVDASPTLRRSLLTALAGEVRRLTGHVEELHFLGLGARLAARLLAEAATTADGAAGGAETRLRWPYTQAEIAGMIGGSRERVNRLLGDLVERGVVRLERDTLVIVDRAALEREASA